MTPSSFGATSVPTSPFEASADVSSYFTFEPVPQGFDFQNRGHYSLFRAVEASDREVDDDDLGTNFVFLCW